MLLVTFSVQVRYIMILMTSYSSTDAASTLVGLGPRLSGDELLALLQDKVRRSVFCILHTYICLRPRNSLDELLRLTLLLKSVSKFVRCMRSGTHVRLGPSLPGDKLLALLYHFSTGDPRA